MKILDVNVIDPRSEGAYLDPWIEVKVDEEVEETDDPRISGRWRVIPCGPFTAIEYASRKGWEGTVDLGRFNTLSLHRDQLIEVKVVWSDDTDDLTMAVSRVRRLLRKYASDWHIVINETAAMRGRVAWRVERIKPRCFGRDHDLQCAVAPAATVWYSGAHVNLCGHHLEKHNNAVRDQRVSNY